jgi:hypothetical protein
MEKEAGVGVGVGAATAAYVTVKMGLWVRGQLVQQVMSSPGHQQRLQHSQIGLAVCKAAQRLGTVPCHQ